ncbi:MAG: hypothetical protein DMF72_20610 [Acidobacteria bacterium]|nr:MAG: hypothetical protein DMF72_20610 [Acidobacteriota bacterium]
MLAALFAAVPLKQTLGQSWKNRDGNPGETPPAQSDPLGNYSKATFRSYLNSIFQLHTVAGIIEVTLLQVDDMPAPKGGECFSLLFRGGSRALSQNTYTIVHPSLGTFALLLVPSGSDQNGAQGYLATINRLSPADFANMSAPSRTSRTAPSSAAPTTSSPPSSNPAPIVTPTVTPVTPSVVPVTPAPARKPRKHRRRKPSWKDDDQRITLVQ